MMVKRTSFSFSRTQATGPSDANDVTNSMILINFKCLAYEEIYILLKVVIFCI